MPTFLSSETYAALIADLACAFTTAANSTTHTLRDLLAEALANADVMPESCRAEFQGPIAAKAA